MKFNHLERHPFGNTATPQRHLGKSTASVAPFSDRTVLDAPLKTSSWMGKASESIIDRSTLNSINRTLTTISPNHTQRGRLTWQDSFNPQRRNRFFDDYDVTGLASGQQVQIDLQSRNFDAYLQVIDRQTGQVVYTNDDRSLFNPNSQLKFDASSSSYTIRVTSFRRYETGRYQLNLKASGSTPDPNPNPNPNPQFNFDYGYGLVDAGAAVAQAVGRSPFTDVANLGGSSWGLDMVNAPESWANGYTGQDVVVAVLDTGVDYRHPDLQGNLWTNPGEIAGNGIDDDSNGYVDDIRGWKFVDQDSNDPMDRDGHGTHVAGTIAALNNGFGVTGVAPNAKIMPVKVIDGNDDASFRRFDINVADGIRYAVNNGAKVISMSIGNEVGDPTMQQTRQALQYARQAGVVVVMASGNERQSGADRPIEPAHFALDDLGIAVGAVRRDNRVAPFSNPAGSNPMDFVVAPGVGIRSTIHNGRYASYSGTSMATPHVSGVVALMLSANPNLTPAQVEEILVSTARTDNLFF